MFNRTEESNFTSWFYEIDRTLLWFILGLIFVGVWAAISAGSVSAERIGQPWHYFIVKALPFYGFGIATLFVSSMLNKKWVLGLSVANVAICMLLLLVTLVAPNVINGSARWVDLGVISLMPADIMKPGFIVITAWFLAAMRNQYGTDIFFNRDAWQPRLLSWWPYLGLFGLTFLIVLGHPDVGTAMLYFMVVAAMLFLAGLPWRLMAVLGGVALAAGPFAFFAFSHVRERLTGTGDGYQARQSIQSIQNGGLLGSGDDAFVKQSLPDAHTDYVFSAIAEDLGAVAACVLLCIFLYVLKRLITNAMSARDPFVFYAVGGAAALFGLQVCINLQAALGIVTKGMTLPFISYGGSSFVAFCLLFGMILALVREDKWK